MIIVPDIDGDLFKGQIVVMMDWQILQVFGAMKLFHQPDRKVAVIRILAEIVQAPQLRVQNVTNGGIGIGVGDGDNGPNGALGRIDEKQRMTGVLFVQVFVQAFVQIVVQALFDEGGRFEANVAVEISLERKETRHAP